MQNKKTVCVDLDGTLAHYDGWKGIDHIGDPIDGAKEFLSKLSEDYRVIIYTTRTNGLQNLEAVQKKLNDPYLCGETASEILVEIIENWLDKHELPYDEIWKGQGKPMCHAFIDDRAISCRPLEDGFAYQSVLHRLRYLK